MSRTRARLRNRPVRIKHTSHGWVRTIVCGYVSQTYAEFTEDADKASVYRWWQADRFIRKWLSPTTAPDFQIVE